MLNAESNPIGHLHCWLEKIIMSATNHFIIRCTESMACVQTKMKNAHNFRDLPSDQPTTTIWGVGVIVVGMNDEVDKEVLHKQVVAISCNVLLEC